MPARAAARWLEHVRALPVQTVAAELAIESCCPACRARSAVELAADQLGWCCRQCCACGDPLDFAAYALRGRKLAELGPEGSEDVCEWCQQRLCCAR